MGSDYSLNIKWHKSCSEIKAPGMFMWLEKSIIESSACFLGLYIQACINLYKMNFHENMFSMFGPVNRSSDFTERKKSSHQTKTEY